MTAGSAAWASRWRVGDGVWVYVAEARGTGANRGWRISAIEGHLAGIESGSMRLRLPLWMLHRHRVEDASDVIERFTEPRWIIDLGEEMLVPGESGSRYPERGAVARAVKQYLGVHGIEVSTRVEGGAWVTSIALRSPSGTWTMAQASEMERLLLGNRASRESADFEPWKREGDAYDPYADYAGKRPPLMGAGRSSSSWRGTGGSRSYAGRRAGVTSGSISALCGAPHNAELERDIIHERVIAGVRRAQVAGKHCGRPKVNLELRPAVAMLKEGRALREISEILGVSRSTLRRRIQDCGMWPSVAPSDVVVEG